MALVVGKVALITGNITQLKAFGAMPPNRVEENLGYHAGHLAKVVPVIPNMKHASPARQHPMGGGFLQWRLKDPGKSFLVAAFVNAQGLAQAPSFTARTDIGAPYDERARFRLCFEEIS
jgi:hypothetical protein